MTDLIKQLDFIYNDGGRISAGYKELTRDCVTRAITIAADLDYKFVHDCINRACKQERKYLGFTRTIIRRVKHGKFNADEGVTRRVIDEFVLGGLCWNWISTVNHNTFLDLPSKGKLLVLLSNHLVAVIDGVIHDLGNSSYSRPILGYYQECQLLSKQESK